MSSPQFAPEPDFTEPEAPAGPWDADVWYLEGSRATTGLARSLDVCVVTWCGRPANHRSVIIDGWRQPTSRPLCAGHRSRWARSGEPDLATFVEDQGTAKPFRGDPTRPIAAVHMTKFPARMRAEIKAVIAAKVLNGEWTLNVHLRTFLIELGGITEGLPATMSFLDRDLDWWGLRLSTAVAGRRAKSWFTQNGRGRLYTVVRHLEFSKITDPWAEDYWTPTRCRVTNEKTSPSTHVDWRRMQSTWLRDGVRSYAADMLRAGSRSWATVRSWARAFTLLDAYLVEEGVQRPEDLTRDVFKGFLRWVVEHGDTKTRRRYVSTAAAVLGDLRDEEYLPTLPHTVFLRRGENPTRPTRDPKPIPADVVKQIDRILDTAPELTPTMRRLFWLFRRGGPRPSEAVDIPIDAIQRTARGNYKVEYYMSKVEEWRSFPIPGELGEELMDQAAWVRATYGPEAKVLFPNEMASSPAKGEFQGRCATYTPEALRRRLAALFERHGLAPSSMESGEYRGGQLHRFRHTIATELLNADWSQYEVQKFLGHKSQTMMQHYAKINDDKLAEKYKQALGLVDKNGAPATLGIEDDPDLTVDRMAQHLMKAALPSGFCGLPDHIACSFRPNPCLNCDFYRTGKAFLGTHIRHRSEVEAMIERAKSDGNERIVELNQPTLDHLNLLIPRIEAADPGDLVAPR